MLKRVGKVVFNCFKRRPVKNVWSLGGRGECCTAQRGVANVVHISCVLWEWAPHPTCQGWLNM